MDEDPAQLVGPRPAAVRGEEKRRLSADAPEFRRQSVFSSQTGFADGSKVACQSGAKRKQARAAQADPGPDWACRPRPIGIEIMLPLLC